MELEMEEETIMWNLKMFLPYICDCVQATNLLSFLHFYTKEQRREIFDLSNSRPHSATKKTLEILIKDIHEPGKYAALKDCMDLYNYPKIAEILIGKHIPGDQNCQKIVNLFSAEITARLKPIELFPLLRRYNILEDEECEQIRAEQMNHGSGRACWLMLFFLPCRQKNWFKYFLLTLMESKFEDLAEKLDPDLYEKLVAQKNFKDESERSTDEESMSLIYEARQTTKIQVNTVSDYQAEELGKDGMIPDAEFDKIVHDIDEIVEKADLEETKENSDGKNEKVVLEDFSCLLDNENKVNDTITDTQVIDSTQIIRYSRKFLLKLQDSPFAQYTPVEASKFPEITLQPQRKSPKRNLIPSNHRDLESKRPKNGHKPDIPTSKLAESTSTGEQTLRKNVTDDECTQPKQLHDINEEVETEPKVIYQRVTAIEEGAAGNVDVDTPDDNVKVDLEDEFRRLLLEDIKADHAQNDLSAETNKNKQDTKEYNIKTDEDELGQTQDQDIELRNYQEELARDGREGYNVIIMAPTNSGKTRVGCAIIQSHLRRRQQSEQIGRVVFIVENEALARQQGKEFEDLLPGYRTKVITGSIQRDKKQYLKDFVYRRDILVVTAMVLVNTLQDKEIDSLSSAFTMIMFDECHHTSGCHPYNQIMSKYMDIKLNKNRNPAILPQIVGLTASIGVGGTTDEKSAMDHMRKTMSNMDAAYLCTVRQNVVELKKYENPPIEETVQVQPRKEDVFRRKLVECMQAIDELITTHPAILALEEKFEGLTKVCQLPPVYTWGTEQFIQWLSEFKKTIAEFSSKEVIRMLNPCREHLQVYNKTLMIHRDARVKEARKVLDVYMQEEVHDNPVKDETDNRLIEIYKNVGDIDYENIPENPKLIKLQELMMRVLGNNPDARGIIFVKTRELARALISWTKQTPELVQLNADYFVGANAAASTGGMTKCGQKDVLEYFRGGKHKLIIATSVAEEGLDIAKCNLVIRYEHVTNEIVRLQSRGRARAENSKYYVVTEVGSWIAAKEEKNQLLEILMNRLVPIVQQKIETDQQQWQKDMKEIQKEAKEKERSKLKEMEEKDTEPWQLQCLNCTKFICWSTDVKKIQNAHHVVIDDEVKKRIVTVRNPFPKYEESELKFDGDIFCLECCHRLGGVCEYKRVEFPLLKVELLRLSDKDNSFGYTKKKWKKVPFYMEKFTLDDLSVVAERKLAELGDDI